MFTKEKQRELLKQAYEQALKSPDPSTQNGALLVDHVGYVLSADCNRFPDNVRELPERWERPLKYEVIEHAERNTIFAAGRAGVAIKDLILVCPWAACSDCARAIIQSGCKALITHKQAYDRSPDRWKESISIALTMLEETGVEIIWFDGSVGAKEVRHSGEVWNP